MEARIEQADCLDWLKRQDDDSVDLIITSPPYEAARTYGIDFKLRGQDWVDWALERYVECVRVSRGLVAWVIEGQTRQFRWSATPALLMADLHRAGVKLRKPPIFKMSYRVSAGSRVNQWGHSKRSGGTQVVDGKVRSGKDRPSYKETKKYNGVTLANPGNVIECKVGGGLMGSKIAHENEAPFPESLAEFFILSFSPPRGIVCDIFSGSGTTAAVALKSNRNFIGCDIRASQVELTKRRIAEVQPLLL